MSSQSSCIFCTIVKGIFKLLETETMLAFMDIGPIARGHCLVIPKYHAAKLSDLPDHQMGDILPALAKIASASGNENYNILQNNGRPAHQEVDHVHFHYIPKPADAGDKAGLVVGWPIQGLSQEEIRTSYDELKRKL
ncbi:HIT-like protein [Cutaneotrichosporon oleaginosum]|uniref:HIT-like protein n=1 Tax=Cutaneotrichosporon oleaginosum TaxID=879819 RepID=A0A0J0XEM2_9TREE|nr:HIT-like protein [Cutaneotrichosporon oleaginosum]KLT39498.1 HIT-like protein [Cutaneotrichosporon oleaginosum]